MPMLKYKVRYSHIVTQCVTRERLQRRGKKGKIEGRAWEESPRQNRTGLAGPMSLYNSWRQARCLAVLKPPHDMLLAVLVLLLAAPSLAAPPAFEQWREYITH
jgi:hypothetical protein